MNRTPKHPGYFIGIQMRQCGLNQKKLAEKILRSDAFIGLLLKGKSRVTADTALRLGAFFNTSPELWLNLQQKYDLWKASQKDEWKTIQPLEETI
jgi:addiction module HigA family antidote